MPTTVDGIFDRRWQSETLAGQGLNPNAANNYQKINFFELAVNGSDIASFWGFSLCSEKLQDFFELLAAATIPRQWPIKNPRRG